MVRKWALALHLFKNAAFLTTRLLRRSIQLSPTAGSSNSNSFQHASSTRPLEKAVEVAEDAADQGKIEGVTEIIEGATNALHRTSKIPARHLMAVGESLQISKSSLNFFEDLSEISEIFFSSDKMFSNFSRTIFIRGVPPARATVSKPYTARGRFPESERGDVVIDINEAMRGVPSNSEAFNSPTPVRVYPNESGGSIAID